MTYDDPMIIAKNSRLSITDIIYLDFYYFGKMPF
jgi:hypothetical protein